MSRADVITLPKLFFKVAQELPHIRSTAKGLLLSARQKSDTPLGLGLLLEEAVEKNPHGIAIAYEDTRISYQDFNAWVNQLAAVFRKQGLIKGDKVAVFVENRPELLAVVAALSKLGVVAVMVNTSQKGKVLLHSLTLVDIDAFVVGEECVAAFEDVREGVAPAEDSVFWLADCDTLKDAGTAPSKYRNLSLEIKRKSKQNPELIETYPSDHCFYIFTSGTTGLPKASVISHGRFVKAYGGFGISAMRLTPDDIFYVTLPFYHATALVICWGCALAGTSTLAMARRFSASKFWDDVRRFDATSMAYVGEICRYLMNNPPSPEDRNNRVTKMIGNGLRPAIWRDFKKRFDVKRVMELYGASEGNIGFTNILNFDNTVGFSPVKYELVKYDKETGAPIRNRKGFMEKVGRHGVGLMLGRIDEKTPFDGYTSEEKSEAVILRDVFKKGDAWFNSGDILRDLGFNHAQFVDRLGDTFRWKGENVSTTELEGVVADHPAISESVAFGVEIPNTNGKAGMVVVTQAEQQTLDGQELYEFLAGQLPSYAIPLFVRITDSLAVTGTFKYQKSDLKAAGFNPDKTEDDVWVLLPGETAYQPMTLEIYQDIRSGVYRY